MWAGVLLLVFPLLVRAEDLRNSADSIVEIINSDAHDSLKANALIELANVYHISKPDTMLSLCERAMVIIDMLKKSATASELVGLERMQSEGLNNMGYYYLSSGSSAVALDLFTQALEISHRIKAKIKEAQILNNIAVIHYNYGEIEKALEAFGKSLVLKEKLDNKHGMAMSLLNMAFVYQLQGEYEKAEEYWKRTIPLWEELDDSKGLGNAYNNLGTQYHEIGKLEKASEYINKGLNYWMEIDFKQGIAQSYNNLSLLERDLDNHIKAEEYLKKSLSIFSGINHQKGMCNAHVNMGKLFLSKKDLKNARLHGDTAYGFAESLNYPKQLMDASEVMFQVFEEEGDFEAAMKFQELYIKMKDSITNNETQKAAIKQSMNYKHGKNILQLQQEKERKRLVAEKEGERQELVVYSLSGGLGLVFLFSLFLFGRFQLISKQKKTIEGQKAVVDEKNKEIVDSLKFAKKIQKAILPTEERFQELLPDCFVFFQPKDIVSGDFYWIQEQDGKVYFAGCDCTGHGVPGAFMSMVGTSQLDEAVQDKGITKPNEIFHEVRKGFIESLKQTGKQGEHKDGMDAVLCVWDKKNHLDVAAAFNPLVLIRDGEMKEIRPDKMPVGLHTGEKKPYTHHEVELKKGDVVYLFSDGFPDQFGGPKGKKFKSRNFKNLLLSLHQKEMTEQKAVLNTTINEWMGEVEQVDDILVIGVRF